MDMLKMSHQDIPRAGDTMEPITLHRHPPHTAPKGAPVLVAGGVAMLKTDGLWYSGMTDEPFTRPCIWEPKWWAEIPQQND